MSLLFFDGFQDTALVPKPEWLPPAAAISVGAGRDGASNSALVLPYAGAQFRELSLSSPATTCIAGFAWSCATSRHLTYVSANNYTIGFLRSGVVECVVFPNASGMLELRRTSRTGTLLATSSGHSPILPTTWPHIQVKVRLHDTSGIAEVKLNDVTVINYSGPTADVTGDVTSINLGGGIASFVSGEVCSFDDFWVCDGVDAAATQRAANNDFLGDLKVVSLFPTGVGDSTQWTPSTGANYAALDETPPNTTDYVSAVDSGLRDLYSLENFPSGAINPKAIRVGLYVQKSDAGAAAIKALIKENSVTTAGLAMSLPQSWVSYYDVIRTVKPSDNSAWTITDLNALQAGVELA